MLLIIEATSAVKGAVSYIRTGNISTVCNLHTETGHYVDGRPAYFDRIVDGIYDYVDQDGYNNLDSWIEAAVRKH